MALFVCQLCSAAPTLTARVEHPEIRPGAYTTYVITISGATPDAVSQPTLPPGVELAAQGMSYRRENSINNGVLTSTSVVGWQITSSTPGEYVIPAQEIHVGGRPFETNEVRLVVKEDAASPSSQLDPMLTIETSKREFYVGEVVPITANLYVHMSTRLRRVGLIEMPKDNFAIQRFPTQADQTEIQMGGKPYISLTFPSSLSGMKPGKFKLGPATSEIILDVPLTNGLHQNPLFGMGEQRKLNPQSNDIDVTVLPLPEEGKPKDFKGVVGDFEISMTADPRSLTVGDPIAVEIIITGSGNFDALTAPELSNATQWKTYPPRRFNVGSSNVATEGPQTATFSQVIIPTQQVAEVPSFEFSYFSPEKKKYITLRTPPLPVQVKVGEPRVEPPPASASASTPGAANNFPDKVAQARPKITDILTVSGTSPHFLALRPPLWKDQAFVKANAMAAGALLLLLCGKLAVVLMRSRGQDPHGVERKLWRQLNARELPRRQFYDLAASYIHEKHLEGASLQPILTNHHTLSYGRPSDKGDTPITAEERDKVLQTLKADPAEVPQS